MNRCRSFQPGAFLLATSAMALGISAQHSGFAQSRSIDAANSTMRVRAYKAGVLGAFGHDHQIAAPITAGKVDATARSVELRVRAADLRVQDPDASEKDRNEIQKTMLGPEVLDVERYPEITFRATSAEPTAANTWALHGELTLHGQTRPINVEVREQGGHYTGNSRFRQSEFGITPVKIAGGAVKVKDEVRIEFDIRLAN